MMLDALRRSPNRLLNVAGILVFLVAWQLVTTYGGVNEFMFPPPTAVALSMVHMFSNGTLTTDIEISGIRVALGFVFGGTAGIIAGAILARGWLLRGLLEPLIQIFRSIPAIALVPLVIVWLGLGETSKISLISWAVFFPVWINTFLGVTHINQQYIRAALSLGSSKRGLLTSVILPAALPSIIVGLRSAIAVAFIVLVAAEMEGASRGLGYLIQEAHLVMRVDQMFVGLFWLGVMGFGSDRLFALLVDRVMPWYHLERTAS